MRIAVPYCDGSVVPVYEQATVFKIYDTEFERITGSEVLTCDKEGSEEAAAFLDRQEVEVVLCGAISGTSIALLDMKGIHFQWGCLGSADEEVMRFLMEQKYLRSSACGMSCGSSECGCGNEYDCDGGCGCE